MKKRTYPEDSEEFMAALKERQQVAEERQKTFDRAAFEIRRAQRAVAETSS